MKRITFWFFMMIASCIFLNYCSNQSSSESGDKMVGLQTEEKDLKLVDYKMDSIVQPRVFKINHEIYLGFVQDSADIKMLLHFDSLKAINFEMLEGEIQKIASEELSKETKITFGVRGWYKAQKNVPYHSVRYVELLLMKHNLLNISYVNKFGQELSTRLPPFPSNDCMYMYPTTNPRECFDWELMSNDEIEYLESVGLDPLWKPIAKRNETKIKEENLFHIEIYPPDDLITINDKPIEVESLNKIALEHITRQHPAKAIFLIETDGMANFGAFFEVFARLLEMYRNKKQEVAKERYDSVFDALSREEQIKIRSDFPEIISINKK